MSFKNIPIDIIQYEIFEFYELYPNKIIDIYYKINGLICNFRSICIYNNLYLFFIYLIINFRYIV